MKILAVDSSSATASVALIEEEKIVSEFFMNVGLTHSETLAPMIKSVLDGSKINSSEIDLFAVSTGPGSFTGLRIGLSTIKAMALVHNKPCVGVSSLGALAYNCIGKKITVCSCMDARGGGVYNALFEINGEKIIRLTEDRAIFVEDLILELRNLDNRIQFVGDGASICYNSMATNYTGDNIFLISENNRYIKASNIAFAAREMYESGICDDSCTIGVNYIRVPQAQRILEEKNRKQVNK